MKHYTFDIEDSNAPTVTKWARATFGKSKPDGVKMSQMLWWRRSMYVYNDADTYTYNCGRPIVRFYFKRESDYTAFVLRWM
jgi:hypothetical protein